MKEQTSKKIIKGVLILMIFTSFSIMSILINNNDVSRRDSIDINEGNNFNRGIEDLPQLSVVQPNSRPLLITQHAQVSSSYFPLSLPTKVSFTLVDGWTSKNITINYESVSYQKDWVSNGTFTSNADGWGSYTSDAGELIINGWQAGGYVDIEVDSGGKIANDIVYYEQNISIPEPFSSNKLATISMDYYYIQGGPSIPQNVTAYLAIEINDKEINKTIDWADLVQDTWTQMSITYDPNSESHTLPDNATIRAGVFIEDDTSVQASPHNFRVDNVEYKVWTKPNISEIIEARDFEDMANYTYTNTDYGEGFSFVDVERTKNETTDIKFQISQNITGVEDFEIYNITMSSYITKEFNTTISGTTGSSYETGGNINWTLQGLFIQPFTYLENWIEIEKPSDWIVNHIYDAYQVDKIGSCTGTEHGSQRIVIPKNVYSAGLWEIEAISQNYVDEGYLGLWNGSDFESSTKVTINDIFQLNVTLNDTITLANTQVNCTLKYPNGTIFWQGNQVPSTYSVSFGNFTVGANMTVGLYDVIMEWTNNISSLERDKVGYIDYQFEVWHSTNLTAVDSYIEALVGDPVLIKVNFTDYDLNTYIALGTITYNSTFGQNGTMAYIGSGIYIIDLDTSPLSLGDYYFSFNASKEHYENQTEVDLIHLKLVAQPLALEVPLTTINAMGNDYAVCQINVTGAISGGLIWPANVSTDWEKNYTVTEHFNGTYTLNFSTEDLPPSGVLENYVVTIYANKTDYGSTSGLITLTINPIATNASVNETIVNAYLNENFDVKTNFTLNSTGTLISGAICSVTWAGSSTVSPISDEFVINLDTFGLDLDVYIALIKLEKAGYETFYKSVVVVIQEQDINLTVMLNDELVNENTLINLYFKQSINVSAQALALGEQIYLSGGNITWVSDNYEENLTESPSTYYNSSVVMDAANFSAGINYIYLRFQKDNYTTKLFSFQAFVSEQDVNLTVEINYLNISEDTLINLYFKEEINISVRAYAEIEKIYLTGGIITWISDKYEQNLTESPSTYFNSTVMIDGANFSAGLNYINIQFQQGNYTTTSFSFQLFIRAQAINITLEIDSQEQPQNYLVETTFNDVFNISCQAYAVIEKINLTSGNFTFNLGSYQQSLIEYGNTWFNTTITVSTVIFDLGINYVYLKFMQENYTATTFSFQVQVNQVEVDVTTLDFKDLIEVLEEATFTIEIELKDVFDASSIEGATVTYSWDYGVGTFTEIGNGKYAFTLSIPTGIIGSFKMDLIISKDDVRYKTTQASFYISVSEIERPNIILMIIVIGAIAAASIFGIMSYRSYVILPKKRKKELALLMRTQRFKDMRNLRAVVLVHKRSGLLMHTESYSFLDDENKLIFTGFTQALIQFAESLYQERSLQKEVKKKRAGDKGTLLDLDFKFFQCLIYDFEQLRTIFILREPPSDRMKDIIRDLAAAIYSDCQEDIDNFVGLLEDLEKKLPPIIHRFLDLHYKESFKITQNTARLSRAKDEILTDMATRVLNVISSYAPSGESFEFYTVFELIHEKNEDLIIDALELLIENRLIIPHNTVEEIEKVMEEIKEDTPKKNEKTSDSINKLKR